MTSKQQAIIDLVRITCSEDPSMTSHVIEAASIGVKDFADKQTLTSIALANRMIDILDNVPSNKINTINFGHFTKEDVIGKMEEFFGGTPGYENLKKKFGVE